jgi:hypothetical protein
MTVPGSARCWTRWMARSPPPATAPTQRDRHLQLIVERGRLGWQSTKKLLMRRLKGVTDLNGSAGAETMQRYGRSLNLDTGSVGRNCHRLGSMLRAEHSALAQSGVLEGPQVQLNNGLARTKKTANLAAGGAVPLYPSFMPGGSEVLR